MTIRQSLLPPHIPHTFADSLRDIGWIAIFASFSLFLSVGWACQSPTNTETIPEITQEPTAETAKESPSTEPIAEPQTNEPTAERTPESSTEPIAEPQTNEPIAEAQTPDASESTTDNNPSEQTNEPTPESSPEQTNEPTSESSPEQATKTFSLEGLIADFFAPGNPTLGGVKVCLYQRPSTPCVLSAQDGSYVLSGVPFDTEVAVTFEDSTRDLVPMMFPFYADSKDFVTSIPRIRAEMFNKTVASQIATLLGIGNLDWTKAQVGAELQELNPFLKPVVGGTVAMTPISGTGPIYLPNPGQSGATSTQDAGLAIFFNVDPNKDYEFVFSHPQRRCYPDNRTRRTATTSRMTAVAGWFVVTSWLCDTLPPTP